MADRITIDIGGYRTELERLADLGERTITQQVRLFIREGIKKHQPIVDEQPTIRDCTIPPDIEEIIRKSASGKKLDNIESDKLKNYFNIDD
ncbi:hypothetical protein PRNO82_04918 (plasmid) [Planktothrix rubescens]|nr:hypothetical protein PRNO82_04918 [Planktothrix rubescens]